MWDGPGAGVDLVSAVRQVALNTGPAGKPGEFYKMEDCGFQTYARRRF